MRSKCVALMLGSYLSLILIGCGSESVQEESVDTVVQHGVSTEVDEPESSYVEEETLTSEVEEEPRQVPISEVGLQSDSYVDVTHIEKNEGSTYAADEPILGDDYDFDLSAYADDVIGSYNGVNLTLEGNDINILLDDGWEYDERYYSGDEGITLKSGDGKYASSIFFEVHAWDTMARFDDASDLEKELETNGFFSYHISLSKSENKPNMTFNGLTWGATEEDVRAAYGEPDYVYSGDSSELLQYYLTEYVSIKFYIYHLENCDEGLQEVNVQAYNWTNLYN